MLAEIVPHKQIPQLSETVTKADLELLRRFGSEGFLLHSQVQAMGVEKGVEHLAERGFLDLGYWLPEGSQERQPYLWRLNGNAQRVLAYRSGLRYQPHATLTAQLLADWIEAQGADTWWSVSNEPYLITELNLPASAERFAEALRAKRQGLLLAVPADSPFQDKQLSELGDLASPGIVELRFGNRFLKLAWEDDWRDWRLQEDRGMADFVKRREAQFALDRALYGEPTR